ncbi:MAG: hypothetical protein ACTSYD_02765 [Candidatus Heimdallarchaeaceae archaeon]
MSEEELRAYLSDPTRRLVLSNIISLSRSVSATEILNRVPISNRSTVYNILDRLSELGVIKKQEIRFGGTTRVFYSPNYEVISSHTFHKILETYDDLDWPSTLSLEFKYTWNHFPECLIEGNYLNLHIVYGSWLSEAASTMDAVYIPEISKLLTYWAVKFKQLPLGSIRIDSYLDYQTGPIKNENLLVIGSGAVNRVSAEIMELYGDSLPIRFISSTSKTIYSGLTDSTYSERTDTGLLSGILGLIPNPWNRSKLVILCAGAKYAGTQAALRVILDDLTNIISIKERILTNHPKMNDVPLRIVQAEGEDILSSMLRQRGNRIDKYRFLE